MSTHRHQAKTGSATLSLTGRQFLLSAFFLAVLPHCSALQDQQAEASGGGGTDPASGGVSLGGDVSESGGALIGGTGSGGALAGTGGGSGGALVSTGGALVSTGGALAGTGGALVGTGGVIAASDCPGNAADAFEGVPRAVPGTIEAEDFDPEGYSDTTTGNEGDSYRTDVDVDIKELGAGYAIGWMRAGEWLEYTISVPSAGDYNVVVRAGAVGSNRTLELSQCGTSLTDPIAIPEISDRGEVGSTTAGPVHLSTGLQVIRITVGPNSFLDFDSLTFQEGPAGTGGAGGTGGTETGGAPSGGAATGGVETGGVEAGGAQTGGVQIGTGGTLPKFVGNITTGWNAGMDQGDRVYSDYWDQVTPENAGKWGSVQQSPSSGFNWNTLDAVYDYARQKGIIFKQHTFLWGTQQPEPQSGITENHVKTWMKEFCDRYPETRIIDVVNEPPPHTNPGYTNAIGGGTNGNWAWIANAFKWADEACPNAILLLNDYNNIEWSNDHQHFIDIVKKIQALDAPIDAVGCQAHDLDHGSVQSSSVKSMIADLHEQTGLPVYITEFDISTSDDNAQLRKYQDYFPFFMDTEYIHGITIWGWIYGSTWNMAPESGLVRNGSPRPAMTWLMEQLDRPAP